LPLKECQHCRNQKKRGPKDNTKPIKTDDYSGTPLPFMPSEIAHRLDHFFDLCPRRPSSY